MHIIAYFFKKGTQISQKGNSKYVKRELFCVKTACEEVSKFGNELLQNFNDIKICSCNDTLDKYHNEYYNKGV